MFLKTTIGFAALAAAAFFAAGSAPASTKLDPPSAAVPMVTGIGEGGGPYLTEFDQRGAWRAGFLPYFDFTQGGLSVAVGDVDGDHHADIVTAPGRGGRAELRTFDATGRRESPTVFAGAGNCGVRIAAGDVNGDGKADLIAGNDQCGSPNIQVFDGASGKRIAFFATHSDPQGKVGVRVAAGDVNGDGKAEIVTGSAPGDSPSVSVYPGVPSGFSPDAIRTLQPFDTAVTSGVEVAAADVNGDKKADVIVGAETADGAQIKVFDGSTGTLLATIPAFGIVTAGSLRVAAGDLDADGKAEIVAAATLSGVPEIRVFSADGKLTASFPGAFYSSPESIAVGDLDGDGKAEIVASAGPGYDAGVTILDGSGTYRSGFAAYDYSFTGGVRVAAGDLAGDGHTEWVTGQGSGGGGELGVFDGNGEQLLELYPFGETWHGLFVAAGDVTGDRTADIVAGQDQYGEPRVKVYDGKGKELSSFLAFDKSFTGGVRVATGDVNGDGTAEIIAGAGPGGPPLVRVFDASGRQLASFFAFDPFFSGGVSVAAADLDGDGKAEIVVGAGSGGSPDVAIFDVAGRKLGSFTAYDPGFQNGVRVAAGDVDGDGKAEIVTAPGYGRPVDVNTFAADGTLVSSFRAHPDFQGGLFVALQQPLGPPLRASGQPISTSEGALTEVVATVDDPGGDESADALAATIYLGDGTSSAGTISRDGRGRYTVVGFVRYARAGHYAMTVRIVDQSRRAANATATATISDAPLSAWGWRLRPKAGRRFRGVVATVLDVNDLGTAADLRARVSWGDRTSSAGRFVLLGRHLLGVVADHRYRRPAKYAVVVRVRDVGGSRATARGQALVTR
jgi:hypothetical protein